VGADEAAGLARGADGLGAAMFCVNYLAVVAMPLLGLVWL